jgi:pimeloyl-ACP methyl ester carboxylesterase
MLCERTIESGGAQLCAQAFGDPSRPTVLLVAGTSCSMDWWPPDFCADLAGRGFRVLRFDQRDTGRATYDPPGQPSYALPDLVHDALAVLDAYGVAAATWVGFSQGGWISQLAALDHPARVSELVLMSTRPTGHGPADPDLPEVTDELLKAWAQGTEPDWRDESEVVDYLVAGERGLAAEPFDEQAVRAIAEACVSRAHQVRSAVVNHPMAEQGPRWRERLAGLDVPTLVLHGDRDPLFPLGNATTLAKEIPHARLVVLPGVGHELPRRVWPQVVEHVAAGAGDPH